MLNEIKAHLKIKKDVEFAEYLGVKQTTLSAWRTRNAFDERLIYEKCSFLNYEWLMTGKGPMLKTQVPRSLVEMALPKEITEGVGSINEESKHTIEYLKMKEELLQELLKGKDKLIEVLEQKVKELEERKIKE